MGRNDEILENKALDDDTLDEVIGGKNITGRETLLFKGTTKKAGNTLKTGEKNQASNLLYKEGTADKAKIDGIQFDEGTRFC